MKNEWKISIILILLFVITIVLINYLPGQMFSHQGKLRLNELMPINTKTLKDDYNNYSDWIELYNGYQSDIKLKGYYLSDDEYNTDKWKIPDITIKANSYLIIYADNKNICDLENNICHANFKLSDSGEVITLTDNAGNIVSKLSYPKLINDHTYGYYEGKYTNLTTPTPGKANIKSKINENLKASDFTLKINEYMTDNESFNYTSDGNYYNWVEIYNYGNKDINLCNLTVTDDLKIYNKYQLPCQTIKAQKYKLIYFDKNKDQEKDYILVPFNIKENETFSIYYQDKLVDSVKIIALEKNQSYGLYDDKWYYFYAPTIESVNNAKGVIGD